MLLTTFRSWSRFLAHLALLLVLNLVFDGPALAEQVRLRPQLVKLPAEPERQGSWPDEATIEEAVPSPLPVLPPASERLLPPRLTKSVRPTSPAAKAVSPNLVKAKAFA